MADQQLELDIEFERMEFQNGKFVRKFKLDELPPNDQIQRVVTPQNDISASLEYSGQQEPILLAQTPEGYRIVDGRKRVICARKLGWTTLMAFVREMPVNQAIILSARINNERSSNELTDIAAIRLILEEFPTTADNKTVSWYTGIPIATVKRLVKVAGLNQDLLNAAQDGLVSLSTLTAISKVRGAEKHALKTMQERLQEYEEDGLGWISKKTGKRLQNPPTLYTPNDVRDVQRVVKAKTLKSLPLGLSLPQKRQGYIGVSNKGAVITPDVLDTPEAVAEFCGEAEHVVCLVREL